MSQTDEDQPSFDALVGRNVAEIRKARDLTQTELAQKLTNRGFAYRQQTVAKVESGERSLRFREADAIAQILDVNVDDLLDTSHETLPSDGLILIHQTTQLGKDWNDLAVFVHQMLEHRDALAFTLDRLRRSPERAAKVSTTVLDDAYTTVQAEPLDIVTAAISAFEAEGQMRNAEFASAVEFRRFEEPEDAPDAGHLELDDDLDSLPDERDEVTPIRGRHELPAAARKRDEPTD